MRQLQRLLHDAERTLAQAARTFAQGGEGPTAWQALTDAAVGYAAVLEVDQERRYQEQAARREG